MQTRSSVWCVTFLLFAASCASAEGSDPRANGQLPSPSEPELACTLIGCSDGLTIELQRTTRWSAGDYRIDLVVDGVNVACETRITDDPCDEEATSCTAGTQVRLATARPFECATPPTMNNVPSIYIDKAAAEVKLSVKHDGAELASESIAPRYDAVTPNGPACGPICRQARIPVALR